VIWVLGHWELPEDRATGSNNPKDEKICMVRPTVACDVSFGINKVEWADTWLTLRHVT
jgi:hypothetical protein